MARETLSSPDKTSQDNSQPLITTEADVQPINGMRITIPGEPNPTTIFHLPSGDTQIQNEDFTLIIHGKPQARIEGQVYEAKIDHDNAISKARVGAGIVIFAHYLRGHEQEVKQAIYMEGEQGPFKILLERETLGSSDSKFGKLLLESTRSAGKSDEEMAKILKVKKSTFLGYIYSKRLPRKFPKGIMKAFGLKNDDPLAQLFRTKFQVEDIARRERALLLQKNARRQARSDGGKKN